MDLAQHATRWRRYRPDGSPYLPEDLPLSRAVRHGEVVRDLELIVLDEEGNDHWINVNAAPIRDNKGRITAGIAVFNDITARKRAEAELKESHQELMQVSRMAGMSEVATGVLHNVGNALNSVNVSAYVIANKVRQSRVGEFKKVGNIISNHADDMAAFVTDHPQGKHMAPYLIEIGENLVKE